MTFFKKSFLHRSGYTPSSMSLPPPSPHHLLSFSLPLPSRLSLSSSSHVMLVSSVKEDFDSVSESLDWSDIAHLNSKLVSTSPLSFFHYPLSPLFFSPLLCQISSKDNRDNDASNTSLSNKKKSNPNPSSAHSNPSPPFGRNSTDLGDTTSRPLPSSSVTTSGNGGNGGTSGSSGGGSGTGGSASSPSTVSSAIPGERERAWRELLATKVLSQHSSHYSFCTSLFSIPHLTHFPYSPIFSQ